MNDPRRAADPRPSTSESSPADGPTQTPLASPPPGHAAPPQPASPIGVNERNVTLDIVRGFAMLGILLVNIQLFRGALWPLFLGEQPWDGALDQTIEFATTWFAESKFITSFAFMFGLGTAVQMMRAVDRGESPIGKLPRRFGVLLVIGLLHGFFIWTGDILMLYAICGFGLLLFIRMPVKRLLWWAGGITGVLTLMGTAFGVLGYWSMTAFDVDLEQDAGMEFMEPMIRSAIDAYQTGSYADQLIVRLIELPITQISSVFFAPLLFVLMLLGLAAGKAGIVADLGRFTRLLKHARGWGLGLGLPLNLVMALYGGQDAMMSTTDPQAVAMANLLLPLMFIAPAILAMGYLATLTLACHNARVRDTLSPLAAVGRMAISAYLFQSVVASWFFIITGWYSDASPTVGLIVVVAVWAMLLVICPLWLRAFRMGPVEWLWRSLTYGRPQPFRNRPEPESVSSA